MTLDVNNKSLFGQRSRRTRAKTRAKTLVEHVSYTSSTTLPLPACTHLPSDTFRAPSVQFRQGVSLKQSARRENWSDKAS